MNANLYILVVLVMMPALAFSGEKAPKLTTPQEQLDKKIAELQNMLAAGKNLSGNDFLIHHEAYEDEFARILQSIQEFSLGAQRPPTPPIHICKKTHPK